LQSAAALVLVVVISPTEFRSAAAQPPNRQALRFSTALVAGSAVLSVVEGKTVAAIASPDELCSPPKDPNVDVIGIGRRVEMVCQEPGRARMFGWCDYVTAWARQPDRKQQAKPCTIRLHTTAASNTTRDYSEGKEKG